MSIDPGSFFQNALSKREDREASWLVHLPGVVLEGSQAFDIGPGRIESVGFEIWDRYDGDQSNAAAYGNSRPVFFTGEKRFPQSMSAEVWQTVLEWREDLFRALLLSAPQPVPHPRVSCWYVRERGGTHMQIGASGREWIVGGQFQPMRFALSNAVLKLLADRRTLLVDTRSQWRGTSIEAALDVLALTGEPEFVIAGSRTNLVNQFVHCMAAAEALLLPPKKTAPAGLGLTATFGRYAALLMGSTGEDVESGVALYTGLYKLRSKLIHGEVGTADLLHDATAADTLVRGRVVLTRVITAILAIARRRRVLPTLYEDLLQADRDPSRHAALQSTITEGLER